MFDISPVVSIWMEMSMNWHTKSQGPKKNVFILIGGGSTPDPPTLLVIRVVLLRTLYGELNPFFSQLYILSGYQKLGFTFYFIDLTKSPFHCYIAFCINEIIIQKYRMLRINIRQPMMIFIKLEWRLENWKIISMPMELLFYLIRL